MRERIAAADVVITGEGSFDAQSIQGKTTGRIRELAAAVAKRCVIFAGRADVESADVRALSELEPDPNAAMRNAADLLTELARRWASQGEVTGGAGSRPP